MRNSDAVNNSVLYLTKKEIVLLFVGFACWWFYGLGPCTSSLGSVTKIGVCPDATCPETIFIPKASCKLFQFENTISDQRLFLLLEKHTPNICPVKTAGFTNCFELARYMQNHPNQHAPLKTNWWWRGIVNENVWSGNCDQDFDDFFPSEKWLIVDSFDYDRWQSHCAYSPPSGVYYAYICANDEFDYQGKVAITHSAYVGSIGDAGYCSLQPMITLMFGLPPLLLLNLFSACFSSFYFRKTTCWISIVCVLYFSISFIEGIKSN
jgi:hypothetical protein